MSGWTIGEIDDLKKITRSGSTINDVVSEDEYKWLIENNQLPKMDMGGFYDPNSMFHCLDGSDSITFDMVNDDYCDCKV